MTVNLLTEHQLEPYWFPRDIIIDMGFLGINSESDG